ncbi:MAG: rRNA maturation RNase YbeY [Ferruginibacter sp.]
MKVTFFFLQNSSLLTNRKKLKLFLISLFNNEKTVIDGVLYIFCSDEYLLEINQNYLHHDNFTDIITFTLSSPGEPILGEIYISVDRIKENAQIFSSTITHELHRVIFHGALHLCGYLDKTKKDKVRMTQTENEYLISYFNK